MTTTSAPTLPSHLGDGTQQAAATTASRPVGVAGRNRTRFLLLLAAAALLLVSMLVSVAIGAKFIPVETVWHSLVHRSDGDDSLVIYDLRLPRTILAVVVGLALGVAGALVQALTRNPLADPGILGVNAGASLFVVLAVALFGFTTVGTQVWFALAGAVLVTVAVYLVGSRGRGGGSPLRLTLAGVGIGAVISGIVSAITLVDPQAFDSARSWNAGSVSGRPMTVVLGVLPFIAVGVVLAMITARDLNAIGLGDDLARSLGTKLVRTRVLVVVAVTLLAGAATAAAGPITFVGLMIPPVAKALVGADQRWILAMTCVLSPVLVLVSDIVGRVVMSPAEMPVGIVLSFVGAPALVVLARRLKAGRA